MSAAEALAAFDLTVHDVQQRAFAIGPEPATQWLRQECARRYRERIMALHPDRPGGDAAAAARLNAAADLVRQMRLRIEPAAPPPVYVWTVWHGTMAGTSSTNSTTTGAW